MESSFSQNATTTILIPPQYVPPKSENLIALKTFSSKILGVAWDMPTLNDFVEATNEGPFEKVYEPWVVSGQQVKYRIRAGDKEVATYSYEGPGSVLVYGGESLDGLCQSNNLFDQKSYEIKLSVCEKRINENGVPYIIFEGQAKNIAEYGFMPKVLGIKIAHAVEFLRFFGVVLQTKSEKFPGLSLFIEEKSWFEDKTYYDKAVNQIKETIETIKYIR